MPQRCFVRLQIPGQVPDTRNMRGAVTDLLVAAVAAWAIAMPWEIIVEPHRTSRVVLYVAWACCFVVARLARAEARQRDPQSDL